MNIHKIAFFEGIDSIVIKEIETGCSAKSFNKGETIFKKGDRADFLYILEQGEIDLVFQEKNMSLFSLNQPGEVFGWSSLVEKGVFTSTSICRSATTVQRISKKNIEKIFNQYPEAAVTFYRRLGSIFSKRISKVFE
ncbi:MAG: cyclic nucleotide-binding domain-containing protein [Proteobacteria bacterium]|nr:cyclic nucleotide-binding domain-containing protein [Pseudomonadota bacterium]MBU1586062.1 cyclic nucleotide-binding domain-containing protein [Pseudomonadota bacterium]MBU2455644.1 cyclic nucleotide-binding domain-containing protein [Pseudomonadota bacterium]MBU2629760.1 cyclic nucleotide-binding domain-containing protein [Pseudomonadota bacterium]